MLRARLGHAAPRELGAPAARDAADPRRAASCRASRSSICAATASTRSRGRCARGLVRLADEGGRAILLLNRRGEAPALHCRSCGEGFRCERCDVSLALHAGGRLRCHHCGYSQRAPSECPICGSVELARLGSGTESLSEAVSELLPHIPVLRLDADAVERRGTLDATLERFASEPAAVLVGHADGRQGPRLPRPAAGGGDRRRSGPGLARLPQRGAHVRAARAAGGPQRAARRPRLGRLPGLGSRPARRAAGGRARRRGLPGRRARAPRAPRLPALPPPRARRGRGRPAGRGDGGARRRCARRPSRRCRATSCSGRRRSSACAGASARSCSSRRCGPRAPAACWPSWWPARAARCAARTRAPWSTSTRSSRCLAMAATDHDHDHEHAHDHGAITTTTTITSTITASERRSKKEIEREARARAREMVARSQIRQYPEPVLREPARPVTEFSRRSARARGAHDQAHGRRQRRRPRRQPGRPAAPRARVPPRPRGRRGARARQPGDRRALGRDRRATRRAASRSARCACPSSATCASRWRPRTSTASRCSVDAEGLEARILQHEIDHLDGVLTIDRTTPEARREALAALRPQPGPRR